MELNEAIYAKYHQIPETAKRETDLSGEMAAIWLMKRIFFTVSFGFGSEAGIYQHIEKPVQRFLEW